ncbi:MAG TPA: DNA (cytosine-5-)-methyltransferase [Clostridiales bacterium]|nr:DNA (cytosine-5-)-methyltransferase [Clostridiales bacterium]
MNLTFFDFCSGIGGGRQGLENNGMICLGHSEIDETAETAYQILYGDKRNYGDLTTLNPHDLPSFDILIAGFPCQTFSIVGKREGLSDERGNIIFHLIDIMKKKNTKYFILENVKGLTNHDKGRTFRIIKQELGQAGYNIYYKVLDSEKYGVTQKRERIYIVGIKKELDNGLFVFSQNYIKGNFNSVLEENQEYLFDCNNPTFIKYLNNKYNIGKHSIEDIQKMDNKVLDTRQSDLRIYDKTFPTLRKGRHGLLYVKKGKIYKLNAAEALRLQGFSESTVKKYKKSGIADSIMLSLAGNAMTVNVIQSIGQDLKSALEADFEKEQVS